MRDVDDGDALALCRPRRIAKSRSASRWPSGAVGSSRMRTLGSCDSALAISTSCRSASDRLPTRRRGRNARGRAARAPRRSCAAHRADVEQAEAARLAAERDVLRDREVRQQAELLVDGGDAELDRAAACCRSSTGAPAEADRAGIGASMPERMLIRSTCRRRSGRSARGSRRARRSKRHVVEREHAGKALGQPADLEAQRAARCGDGAGSAMSRQRGGGRGSRPAARSQRAATDRSSTMSASGFSNGNSCDLGDLVVGELQRRLDIVPVTSTPWIRSSVASFFLVATRIGEIGLPEAGILRRKQHGALHHAVSHRFEPAAACRRPRRA